MATQTVWDLERNDIEACRALCERRSITAEEWRIMLRLQDDPAALVAAAKTWGRRADEDGPGARRTFAGSLIVVENPKGSFREWTDADGTTGRTKMRYPYGYIEGAKGSDGDSVDVYLGPSEDAEWVYVVHQQRKPDFTEYDEDKVMLGFDSANHARDAYLAQYDDERFFGGMTVLSLEDFRAKLAEGGKITHAEPEGG